MRQIEKFEARQSWPTCLVLAAMLWFECCPPAPRCNAESFTYGEAGRLMGVRYDDGSSITYTYDNVGNLTSIVSKGPRGAGIGDTNNDNAVDSLDATLVRLLVLFGGDVNALNETLAQFGQQPIDVDLSDVNQDGKSDSLDATLLKLYVLFGKDLNALNQFLQQQALGFTAHIGEAVQ